MKKLLIVLVMSLLVVPTLAEAKTIRAKITDTYMSAPSVFPDVAASHKNYAAVELLINDNVIKGYQDGTFKPNNSINRAELTKMIVVMIDRSQDLSSYKNCFPDVSTEWYAPYVCYAKEKGWVSGYPDGTFRPAGQVNRVEAIKIVLNAMMPDDYWPTPTEAEKKMDAPADAQLNAWYIGYLGFAIAKELLDGQHVYEDAKGFYYKPAGNMTRKEVAEMIYRVKLYMMERLEYGTLIGYTSCLYGRLKDKMTDTELHDQWVSSFLLPAGYTEAEVDELTAKYTSDDVMDAFIKDMAATCLTTNNVDMSRWAWFQAHYDISAYLTVPQS